MYFFWTSSDAAVSYLSYRIGLDRWIHLQHSNILSFFFMMGEIMVRIVLVFFYFSLFKYLFLIIGSPVFAYLSEKTESIIDGKDFPFNGKQFLKDMVRGTRVALRNALWQTIYLLAILVLSLFPVIGWVAPLLSLFLECYYYGFSMLDYSCERHGLSAKESIEFIGGHKGLAIGNGIVFYGMHLAPFFGWVLAPAYAVVAATFSIYHQKDELLAADNP